MFVATDNRKNVRKVTDYCGNFVYENGSLKYIITDEGRLLPKDGGGFEHEYTIKDHLGNSRVVVNDHDNDGEADVMQESHYYPFGMQMEGMAYTNPLQENLNKYMYNGKEMQDDLGLDWYDYGARFYSPEIARWSVIDNKAEKYYLYSPYNYCLNNPLIFVDPDGNDVIPTKRFNNNEARAAGLNLFLKSRTASSFLSKFSSGNDLIKQNNAGKLSNHNIVFNSSNMAHISEGKTNLYYKNGNGDFVEYDPGNSKLSKGVTFQIEVVVSEGLSEGAKEAGGNATTINHEVFAHAEGIGNLIEQFQSGDINLDDLQNGLNQLSTEKSDETEHDNLVNGQIQKYENAHSEMVDETKKQENSANTNSEKNYHKKVRKGLKQGYEGYGYY